MFKSKYKLAILFWMLLIITNNFSAQNSVKNVIILIPDGTSNDVLSFARWYQGNKPLAIDEIICGLVKTHSSDSTIADSAPTGTAYATGLKTISGYVGVGPDSIPGASVLELARQKGLSTGIVVTCQFQHATPADFVCHFPDREATDILSKQFLFNSPDLVMGGGYKYLEDNKLVKTFDSLKYSLIKSYQEFKDFNFSNIRQQPVWALFDGWKGGRRYLSYNCDRDTLKEPGLSEMTAKAIDMLSKNKKGFFMMVEGSQVDWAAHFNDPKAIVTDFLEFDKAVKIALDFAKKSGNTIVIVCPDHANGGISMGNSKSDYISGNKNKYDNLNIYKNMIEPLKKVNHSSRWIIDRLIENIDASGVVNQSNSQINEFLSTEYSISLSDKEMNDILGTLIYCRLNSKSKSYSDSLNKATVAIGRKLSDKIYIGWTTTGHVGEDVFLGIYHPQNKRITGIIDNTEIGKYIAKELKLVDFSKQSQEMFIPVNASSSFKNWKNTGTFPLTFSRDEHKIIIPANTNYYTLDGINHPLQSMIVKIGDDYYIPRKLYNIINQ
jgi:alkaline phosphatase